MGKSTAQVLLEIRTRRCFAALKQDSADIDNAEGSGRLK